MEQVARFVLAHRRLIAAGLVGLAVWSAITALTHEPGTRPVLVAADDLPGGRVLRAGDLSTRALPDDAVPIGALTDDEAVGRVLSGGMRAGEVVTDRRAIAPRDLGDGRVLAVVEVPAATGEVLRPGDRVDVLAVGDDGRAAATVAEGVELVTVRLRPDRDAAVLGIGADRDTAVDLARLSVTSRLNAVLAAAP